MVGEMRCTKVEAGIAVARAVSVALTVGVACGEQAANTMMKMIQRFRCIAAVGIIVY